jgi:hypothetical protein
VAQTSGPLVAGGLVTLLGAPVTVLVDAASSLFPALAIIRIRLTEPPPQTDQPRKLRAEIAEGLRWFYQHRVLGPMAIGSHAWFLFNSMIGTVFVDRFRPHKQQAGLDCHLRIRRRYRLPRCVTVPERPTKRHSELTTVTSLTQRFLSRPLADRSVGRLLSFFDRLTSRGTEEQA